MPRQPQRSIPNTADTATFALHDAQLVIARSYGFDSWPKLKAYVGGVTIRRLVDAVRAGDIAQVRSMLKARPELADLTVSYGDEHRAIQYAVMHRWAEIIRLLMQMRADGFKMKRTRRRGQTPLRGSLETEARFPGRPK